MERERKSKRDNRWRERERVREITDGEREKE